MLILPKEQWVFMPIPKTGTVSMYKTLEDNFTHIKYPRTKLSIPPEYSDFQRFTVVRNPYDRLISWWSAVINRPGDRYGHKAELIEYGLSTSFIDFLTLWSIKKVPTQCWYIEKNKNTKILRLENIDEEFNNLPFVKTNITMYSLNSTEKTKTKDDLTEQEIKAINSMFKKDFDNLGYEML